MGSTYFAHHQEGWYTALLPRLPELERRSDSRLVLLLRLDKCIDSWGETTLFATMDANSGYLQTEVDERDRDKTAYISRHGL